MDFVIKAKSGNYHKLSLKPLNLEQERSIKISKKDWNYELKDNLWVALVLFMKDMEPHLYLIPSKIFEHPNQIFIDNEQGKRFKHLSNWELISRTQLRIINIVSKLRYLLKECQS